MAKKTKGSKGVIPPKKGAKAYIQTAVCLVIVVALALTAGIYGLASKTASKETAATMQLPHRAARRMPAAARPNPIGIQAQTAAVLRSRVLRAAPRVTMLPERKCAAAATGVDAAAAAEAINAATAKAVAAGYHWTKTAQYTQPVDVGSATSGLNTLIKGIDPEASLDSVVGGFIGIGDKEMDIEKGRQRSRAD